MEDSLDAMVALRINDVDVELIGTITAETFDVGLTDYAREMLRQVTLGNVKHAIETLLGYFNVDASGVLKEIEQHVYKIPGVGDLVEVVLETNVHLTEFEYSRGNHLVLGVMFEGPFDITIGTVARLGVTVHKNLKSDSE